MNVAALEIAATVVRIPEESRRRTAEGLEGSGDAGQIGEYEEEEENEGAGRERWCKTEIQFHFIEYILGPSERDFDRNRANETEKPGYKNEMRMRPPRPSAPAWWRKY